MTWYMSGFERANPAGLLLDPATTAWAAAVVTNGGSVSAARKGVVNNMIVALKTDGIWVKLDRLFIFAAENSASALTDMVANVLATATNAPTFAANIGYTGDGATSYVDTGFNPSTAPSPHFVQNSGCMFGWNNTTAAAGKTGALCGVNAAGFSTRIYPKFTTDGFYYFGINAGSTADTASAGATGLYVANRTASNSQTLDLNGAQVDSDTNASAAPANGTFITCGETTATLANYQVCCLGFGSQLSSGDRTNLYSRIRAYMTAVGVP